MLDVQRRNNIFSRVRGMRYGGGSIDREGPRDGSG